MTSSPDTPLHLEPGLVDQLLVRVRHTPTLLPDAGALQAFDATLDHIYRSASGGDRRRALDREGAQLVAHLGVTERVARVLRDYAPVQARLARVILSAAAPGDQRVDVHGPDASGSLSLVIRLEVEVWLDAGRMDRTLRHELEHAHDMLDPAFGYDPAAGWPGSTHGQRQQARQRFTAVWCCTVDARLARAGREPTATRDTYAAELTRLISDAAACDRTALIEELSAERRWTHRELLDCAGRRYRGVVAGRGPSGGPCPLCGFPSTDWSDPLTLPGVIVQGIQDDFPGWKPEEGSCLRCRECYESRPRAAGQGRVR